MNQNQSALKLAWYISSSLDSRLVLFGASSNIAVLMLSPISKKMKVIHSVTKIGGSLTAPGNQVVGLVGIADKDAPILISDNSISANLEIDVPLVEEIKLVRSEVDFDQLDSKPSEKYLGTSFALLTPFLLKMVIETKYYSPTLLFIEFMIAMVTFDREKLSQDESVWTKVKTFFKFFGQQAKTFCNL